MSDFTAIGQLVTEARNLLDSIKGGAIRLMQTTFDDFMWNSRQSVNDFLTQKRSEFSGVLSTVETKAFPYINLLNNSFAREKDSAGNLIFPISTYGLAEIEEVIPYQDMPAEVKAEYDKYFPSGKASWLPNVLHVRFPEGVEPSYWLPGNPVKGNYTLGFAMAYVARGNFAGITEGQSGEIIQKTTRSMWHIDGAFRGASDGLDVYLVLPYVVAGHCPSSRLISSIPSYTKKLALNVG
ncbi:hypothetical protein AB4077_19245 [Vibrio cyclitrophicus]|uniref:hypothetical protein n=1 Tax=Vibrio cyclitrophicus TaxID=47951 RepID=UPI000C82ECB7|nr:hypothetical protein [Vibrio cyclitrophicus]MCC4774979.1 hypothetical protein [Vibrio cyclitrophicus]MCC4844088.1 hypothetical protein [Vibrio cyclitrophicus]PME12661.1 hypothetical protein BCV42_18870 [Vibrio cyclitrophicus]PME36417.1 hypothetical protein BCV37_20810 [Vibrio cyclitrophicus]PME80351.1 hypothetical protein BCV28_19445 [Vibrio cyclitrophicus]